MRDQLRKTIFLNYGTSLRKPERTKFSQKSLHLKLKVQQKICKYKIHKKH